MAKLGMAETIRRVLWSKVAQTAIVHIMVIAILVTACTLITALIFSRSLAFITYELFFIPVLYTAYFYAERGLVVAGICGITYLVTGYFYRSEDPSALAGVASGTLLFLIIAGLMTCCSRWIHAGRVRCGSVPAQFPLGFADISLPDLRIKQTNDTFLSMLHYPADEIAHRAFPSLAFTPREKKRFVGRMEQHHDGENFEIRLRTKEGECCWVSLSWCVIDEQTVRVIVMDINARKVIEEISRTTMLQYRQLTENSPTGILVLQEGRIRSANPAFCTFSGYSPQEVEGKDLPALLDPRDRDMVDKMMGHPAGGTRNANGTKLRFVTKSGGLWVAMAFSSPALNDNQQTITMSLVDSTIQQQLEEKIRQDNERRRSVIMTVAHELRSPLQPILGYLSLLVEDPEGFGIRNDTQKMLGRCLASVERERQIINRMLELSVLDRGKIQLTFSEFSLFTLVSSVLDTCDYVSRDEVTTDIPGDLVIVADKDRLYGVLDSLLSNAVNCSRPPRKIHISYRPGAGGSTHTISMQDNGIGISENMYDSIFEPFQLADAAKLSRTYNRLGLSLSIARTIIRLHGGDITVESTVGVGSTFTIHIPRTLPEENARVP